jgi:glycosyltransferase involved in cell wall biosynthesis
MNTAAGSLVSVVTPFYNTAQYLRECIESVLKQTHRNLEYVLVDNCSTDGSSGIARAFAERDPRVRYVRADTFVDQVSNYNRALREISGTSKYTKIVQADDWIFPSCLYEMTRLADAHPTVGVVGSFSMYGDSIGHVGLPLREAGAFEGRDAIRRFLLTDQNFVGSPTCVMFRSDLVRLRNPFFSAECPDFDDVDACLDLLRTSDFGFVHQVLTFNRRDNESIWTRIARYRPEIIHKYVLLLRYGSRVLDDADYQKRKRQIEGAQHELLARSLLLGDWDLWRYHRQMMATYGLTINTGGVASKSLAEMANIVLNPKMTLGRIVRRIRRRRRV